MAAGKERECREEMTMERRRRRRRGLCGSNIEVREREKCRSTYEEFVITDTGVVESKENTLADIAHVPSSYRYEYGCILCCDQHTLAFVPSSRLVFFFFLWFFSHFCLLLFKLTYILLIRSEALKCAILFLKYRYFVRSIYDILTLFCE